MSLKFDYSLSKIRKQSFSHPRMEAFQYPPCRILIINSKVEVTIKIRLKKRKKKEKKKGNFKVS